MQQLYEDQWNVLSDINNSFVAKIGIRIRVGDSESFQKRNKPENIGESLLAKYLHYFQCAEAIENSTLHSSYNNASSTSQKVLWYLIYDSLELRIAAKQFYGNKLLTDTTTRTLHTYCPFNYNPNNLRCNTSSASYLPTQKEALIRAAGDLLSFSLVDFHIFSRESGFGRVGAWLASTTDESHMFSFSAKDKEKVL